MVYWNNRIDRHPDTYFSYSRLINHAVETSPTETMIFINDRCFPTVENVEKILWQLQNGFACVYLYNAGFIGFTKNLIRRIGWWDERHLNGDWSDQEWSIRLKEADLAFYESQEASYTHSWKSPLQGDFKYPDGIPHWNKKWSFEETRVVRNIPELEYPYSLNSVDAPVDLGWKPWSESILGVNYPAGVAASNRLTNKPIIGRNA